MTPIRTKDELAEAISQPRAFLFLWVNWASHARHAQVIVSEVVASWVWEHPNEPAPAYIVDVSDQCGEVWHALAEWLMAQGRPAGNLMMSGAGPLLWLRFGQVVLHVLAPNQHGAAKLAAVSGSVWMA